MRGRRLDAARRLQQERSPRARKFMTRSSPGADVRLLDERNVKWIPRIKAEMKTGVPTAIVAGTLHFCRPNGVVQLLQRGGYKIEQL